MVLWANPSLRPKRHVDRFSRFCTAHRRVSHYFTMRRCVFPQNFPFPLGDRVLHLTHGTYGLPESSPKRNVDRFSCFCMGPKCYNVQYIVNGEENPRNCPSLGILSPGDILADRQTDRQTHRHTQTYSSQYFATAPAGKVITTTISNINTILLQ